jgi:iron complex outermembrane receptor protein
MLLQAIQSHACFRGASRRRGAWARAILQAAVEPASRHSSILALACFVGLLVVTSNALAQSNALGPASPAAPETSAELVNPADPVQDVLGMDLDQLTRADVNVVAPAMEEVVSTVSRQESTVGKSPAAVFVITQEMIRRSGATSIPEVLRMAPGVEVAHINANTWAISIRGFNGAFAGKLLVQIDGRTVYRQAFNGVFWDVQDVVLQDVERIEVIRGPGATVWGANAVNGVINIITKQAKDTQGALVYGGTGTEEQGFSTIRYGGKIGDDFHWRAYGKQFERDGGYSEGPEFDDWRQAHVGYRCDWTPSQDDHITFQGDYLDGESGTDQAVTFATPPFERQLRYNVQNSGQNHLLRWSRVLDEDSDWAVQAYYDELERSGLTVLDAQKTADLDFQYRFPMGERHNVICGAGYRHIDDQLVGHLPFALNWDPQFRSTNLYSCFVQDEITLHEDLWYLTAGSKFQHNFFSGFEAQPSVRLLCTPSERESIWAAVSRAVRTPSRGDQDLVIHGATSPFAPVFVGITGSDSVASEELYAYELGYRAQPVDAFSWDLALFYNNYENLIGVIPAGAPFFDPTVPGLIIPLEFSNSLSADGYGGELSSTCELTPAWRLYGAYSLLYLDVHAPAGDSTEGSSAHNRVYLRSAWDLSEQWELDLIGRYVDNLPALGVSSYTTMDTRLAWRPNKNFEWAIVGRNLLDDRHLEFIDATGVFASSEVQSEVFTTLTWTR